MRRYQLAVMPGDGIGPEVIAESVETLTSVAVVDGHIRGEAEGGDGLE